MINATNETIKKLLSGPIFFKKNRVGRVYTGGALFADFFGDDSTDGYLPEEWVVSTVSALNKGSTIYKEGVSVIADTDIFFDEFVNEYKKEMLGDRDEFGVLTKFLDSAIRLPVQAHPDKAFSRIHFNSNYGKAESWLVLGTRPDACLYFGFKNKITKEEFSKAVEESETNPDAMEKLLNRVPVKTGDVYFVPAKMVHAIGKGCLILEIQEPSDFTIQPEYYCGEYRLSEEEMYIGLDKDTALDVFDYDVYGQDAIDLGKKEPTTVFKSNSIHEESLITYDDTPCFAVTRYTIKNAQLELKHAPAVYVVTNGTGYVNGHIRLKKGDYFFLPHSAEKTCVETQSPEGLEIIACLPPKK